MSQPSASPISAAPGRRQSIRTQLIVWNVLTLALLLGVFGLIVRVAVHAAILASIDSELEHRTHPPPGPPPMDGQPHPGPPPFDDQGPPGQDPSAPHPGDSNSRSFDLGRPRHFDITGRAMNRFSTETPRDRAAVARAAHGETVWSTVASSDGPLRLITRPGHVEQGQIVEIVQAAYPLSDINRSVAGLDRVLLILIPFGLIGAGLGGVLVTGRVLGRVRQMAQAAEQVSAADLGGRLPVTGRDEFADLASTLNAVLERLEGAFKRQQRLIEQQRRFTADASHELKTPLTIIKGNTSMALLSAEANSSTQTSFLEIDRAADTMTRLVYDLLLLARSDSGQLAQNTTDLLIGEVLSRALASTPRGGAAIRVHLSEETLTVRGNEDELVRLFGNLLNNAVRHTPEDGQIDIKSLLSGNQIVTTIADTGDGIASRHLPHLGERFYRADAARDRAAGGTGLGLSIVREIAQAHGGSLAIESVVGKGTTVTVSLPSSISLK